MSCHYYDKLPSLTVSPSWLQCRAQAQADFAVRSNWDVTLCLVERIKLLKIFEQTFLENIFLWNLFFSSSCEEDRWHLLSGVGRQVGTKHDSHNTSHHYTCHEITSHNSHTKFATFSPQTFDLNFSVENIFFIFSCICEPFYSYAKVLGLKHFSSTRP